MRLKPPLQPHAVRLRGLRFRAVVGVAREAVAVDVRAGGQGAVV